MGVPYSADHVNWGEVFRAGEKGEARAVVTWKAGLIMGLKADTIPPMDSSLSIYNIKIMLGYY